MIEQLPPSTPSQLRKPNYTIFLAIFPDLLTAECIANLANKLRQKYAISGRARPASHLHVSLPIPPVNTSTDIIETIDRACKAATSITRPFEINFDRVMSFGRGTENHPLVLSKDDWIDNDVMRFHELLWATFEKFDRRPCSIPKFTPHLTVLYDNQTLDSTPIETMFWTVKEIVLVCSDVGATKYQRLGSWTLGG